ncbi:hypothetical protein Tco_1380238 [Tanacetum coccineum]
MLQHTTPIPTPPITSISPTLTTVKPDPLPTVIQRLSDLEKKFETWTKVDHSEAIEASVRANFINEVKNQLLKFLPKVVSDLVNLRIKSLVHVVQILFDKMDKRRSYLSHDKHQELNDALFNSIMLDESIVSGNVNPAKVLKKRDRRDDQDPTARSDQGKKKRRKENDSGPPKDDQGSSSKKDIEEASFENVVNNADDQPNAKAAPKTNNALKNDWFKQPPRPPTPDPKWNKC